MEFCVDAEFVAGKMLRTRFCRQARLFDPVLRALSTEAGSSSGEQQKQQQQQQQEEEDGGKRRDFGFQNVEYSDHRRLVGGVFKV